LGKRSNSGTVKHGNIMPKNYRRISLLDNRYKIFFTLFLDKIVLMALWKINIITYILWCELLEWLRYVWRTGGDVLKNVLIKIINKKRPLGKLSTRWECNVRLDLWQRKWRGLLILVVAQFINGPLSGWWRRRYLTK